MKLLRMMQCSGRQVPAVTPPVVCAYPMSMDEATIQGYGFTGGLTLSNGDQTGERTLTTGSGNWAMASAAPTPIDFSSGNKAVQMDVVSMAAITNTSQATLSTTFYTLGFSALLGVGVVANSSGYLVSTSGLGSYVGPTVGTPPSSIGVTFDSAASEINIKVDGSLVETVAYTPQSLIPILLVAQLAIHADDAGKLVKGTFVTAATSITQSTGTATDQCGNSI